jgi:4-hydroxybenzoyl-CoA thioesterase
VKGERKLALHDSGHLVSLCVARLTLVRFRGDMPAMSNLVGRLKFEILWGHCDPAGIVFNPRFFEYFDRGSWSLFELALGIKPHELYGTFGIIGIPLVDSGARFIAPARFGDEVELTSQIAAFRRSSFDVDHRLFVRGELAVEGRETRVWAGRDPTNPEKLKGLPIPAEVTAKFQAA